MTLNSLESLVLQVEHLHTLDPLHRRHHPLPHPEICSDIAFVSYVAMYNVRIS